MDYIPFVHKQIDVVDGTEFLKQRNDIVVGKLSREIRHVQRVRRVIALVDLSSMRRNEIPNPRNACLC
jgi:hypothetical protein